MRSEDLRRLLRERPFQPFRFFVHEKTSYEVRHPDAAMVSFSTVTILTWEPGPGLLTFGQEVIVSLLHITRLERLSVQSLGNGAAP